MLAEKTNSIWANCITSGPHLKSGLIHPKVIVAHNFNKFVQMINIYTFYLDNGRLELWAWRWLKPKTG
jgi:hypothetical protein